MPSAFESDHPLFFVVRDIKVCTVSESPILSFQSGQFQTAVSISPPYIWRIGTIRSPQELLPTVLCRFYIQTKIKPSLCIRILVEPRLSCSEVFPMFSRVRKYQHIRPVASHPFVAKVVRFVVQTTQLADIGIGEIWHYRFFSYLSA